MSIEAMSSAIAQMQQLSRQSSGISTEAITLGQGNFGQLFNQALNQISQRQVSAADKAQQIEMGQPGVELHDLMIDIQKASISLQLGVQVRNKMIAAYTDIMNMSV